MPEFQILADRLRGVGAEFVIEPYVRFEGEQDEQWTGFLSTGLLYPAGNAMEFKVFADDSEVFATEQVGPIKQGGTVMRVVIAGGHGKIALLLERMLAQRGDSVAGLIRNADQSGDLEAVGAEALVVDLEHSSVAEVTEHVRGADAVVFAAGAGAGSGEGRKETVDRDAAILLADAAEAAGVRRYLMVSAMGADRRTAGSASDQGTDDPVFATYLRAKAAADEAVLSRGGLDATVVRPGLLTDDVGAGTVTIAAETGRGSVSRADVAAVLVAVLETPSTTGQTFELIGGDTLIADAVAAVGR